MHQETLKEVVAELQQMLPGQTLGKVFQLSPVAMAIDFRVRGGHLFISAEPAAPRLYLIKRKVRELERESVPPTAFVQALRKAVGNAPLRSITMDPDERIVRLLFATAEDLNSHHTLVAQLTGRSANLLLLDEKQTIVQTLRPTRGAGQQPGEKYQPPPHSSAGVGHEPLVAMGGWGTLSEALDTLYLEREKENTFAQAAATLREQVGREISRRLKLKSNLKKDLASHGDPEEHKRLGDLLLANIGAAKRQGDRVILTDHYADGQPTIEVTIDANKTLQEAAAASFSRYTKAKRALSEIKDRLARIDEELAELKTRQATIEEAIASKDKSVLETFATTKRPAGAKPKSKDKEKISGVRRYQSSDGYEVMVGRTARDNDNLTFRVARPNDLWLHAGDYPGSHVIVRNSSRKEIPQRTIIEAAQLAAKFSQANKDAKVTIHYTPRKFLSKPKGAASGLVRLASFKTITVEPAENIERVL